MFINFKNIDINNFLSFGHANVSLDKGGYVLVSGINENPVDNANSNGSGKSALFDAIIWCLTGNTSRETKNVSNINGDNGAKVTLTFTVDDDEYTITRTKDCKPLGTTLKIIHNGEDVSGKGIRDTEKILSEYLPDITSSFLGSVIILGQGLPQRFSNNSPSGRKEVLENLSKSDFMINELNDKVSKRRAVLSSNLDEVKQNISYLIGQQKVREQVVSNTDKEIQELKDFRLNANSYLNDCLLSRDKCKFYFEGVQSQVDDAQTSLSNISEQCQEIRSQLTTLKANKLLKENEVRSIYDPSISTTDADVRTLETQIKTLSAISDVCPTCGQKLVGVEKPDISPLEAELAQKKAIKASLVQEKSDKLQVIHDDEVAEESQLVEKQKRLSTFLSDNECKVSQLKRDLSDAQAKYLNSEKVYNEAFARVNSVEESIKQKEALLKESQDCLTDLSKKILYNTDEQKNLEERLSVISKMVTALKRDFRGYLLTNVITYISDRAEYYSKQVFGNDSIGFSLVGNAIEISFDGKEYCNLSGGEKQRVDLIVQLAIRDMLCCFMNFSSNIIVLDEFVDGLDATGCEEILNLIAKNLQDVETVYIITHHASIAIPTDDEIVIVKDANKISSIR